jgi:hypothetical protein
MVPNDPEPFARPGDVDISGSFLFIDSHGHPEKFPIAGGSVLRTARDNDYLIEVISPDDHLSFKLMNMSEYSTSELYVLLALNNAAKLLFEHCSVNNVYERRIRLLGSFLDGHEDRLFWLLTGQKLPVDSKNSHIRRISKIDL